MNHPEALFLLIPALATIIPVGIAAIRMTLNPSAEQMLDDDDK